MGRVRLHLPSILKCMEAAICTLSCQAQKVPSGLHGSCQAPELLRGVAARYIMELIEIEEKARRLVVQARKPNQGVEANCSGSALQAIEREKKLQSIEAQTPESLSLSG